MKMNWLCNIISDRPLRQAAILLLNTGGDLYRSGAASAVAVQNQVSRGGQIISDNNHLIERANNLQQYQSFDGSQASSPSVFLGLT